MLSREIALLIASMENGIIRTKKYPFVRFADLDFIPMAHAEEK